MLVEACIRPLTQSHGIPARRHARRVQLQLGGLELQVTAGMANEKALEHGVQTTTLDDWDGPDDSENPRNWSPRRKWAAVLVVSSFALMSPVASSMVAPALPAMQDEFRIQSSVLGAMMMSIYLLAYAIGPLFLGPLSELYGRKVRSLP